MVQKINTTPSSKKILIAILVLALAVFALWFFIFRDKTPVYTPKYEPSTSKSPTSQNEKTTEEKISSPASSLTGDQIPVATQGKVTILDLNQSNGYVNVATSVENFTVVSCVYQFTSEGARPIVKEFKDECKNTSILENEFEKIGQYTFTVIVYGASDKLTATKAIDIR
jgi:hypothetical protein